MTFLVWDNTIGIVLQSRRGAAGPETRIPVVKRRGILGKELAASGGVYTGNDVVFLVPQVLMPWPAKPADVVTDDTGTRYTVLGADLLKNLWTWKLTTRDLILAFDLRDSINIERASISYDAAGAAVKSFPTQTDNGTTGGSYLAQNMPARVQLLTDAIRDERGIRGFVGTHAIIIADQVNVIAEDRVAWTVNEVTTYFDIVGYHNPERIDELPVLDVEARP